MSKSNMNWRPWVIILSVVLLIMSSMSFFITTNIYNSENFANKTTRAITSEASRDAIAKTVTTEILLEQPLLVKRVLSEPLTALISGLLDTDVFSGVFYEFSYSLNRLLTTNDLEPVTVNVGSVTAAVASLADTFFPNNDLYLERFADEDIVLLEDSDLPPFKTIGDVLMILGPLTFVALIAVGLVSLNKISIKKEMLKYSGMVLVIGGVILLVLTYTSGAILTVSIINPERSIIMNEIYDSFISGFRLIQYLTILAGAALWITYYTQTQDIKVSAQAKK